MEEKLRRIAHRVAHIGKLRGMSKAALAEAVGIHPSSISRLETGAVMPCRGGFGAHCPCPRRPAGELVR